MIIINPSQRDRAMTPQDVAKAWHSVTDRWIVRRNKMHDDGRQWEVVHDWGGDLVSEDTQRLIRRYPDQASAKRKAEKCEDEARGKAVLDALNSNHHGAPLS